MSKRAKRTAPSVAEIATERIELKLTPSQLAAWQAAMEAKGLRTVKQLVIEAVEIYAARDEEGELADLGREVLALADDYRRHSKA